MFGLVTTPKNLRFLCFLCISRFLVLTLTLIAQPEGQSSLPAGPMSENAARLNIGNARFFAARAMLESTVSVHPHGTNTLDKTF